MQADRIALAREWDELVERVRRLDGFADFLRPPRLATLLPAASGGPVVVVNVSRPGCAALVVTPHGVRVQDLSVTADAVTEKTYDYLRVLYDVDDAAREWHLARRRFDEGDHGVDAITRYTVAKQRLVAAERKRDATLVDVLEWLWDAIAGPVLDTLGFAAPPPPGAPWPRIWWCPTSVLTLLPLHAAGYHDAAGRAASRAVVDRVVSSYTPTLRALLHARRADPPVAGDRRFLVVSVPDAGGEVPLESAARERDLLATRFPGRHTLLEGAAATWTAVRAELPRHRWAHFCCHGAQDLADPGQGHLLLHDRPLTITDVGGGRHHGEFAFLSACMTATGGISLLDEAITLTAAMHYTGYRHVIGTLWSVYDDTAAEVADAVYADLTSTGDFAPGRAAHALHKAISGLRDGGEVPLHAWTPFTHTGP